MDAAGLKLGWKRVKFGDVVRNANLTERDAGAAGIERIVGLEHIDPENLHIRRWNSPDDGTSFSRKFVPGQTLFGKRRAYQRKVAFAEFEGICSGDILTFEPKDQNALSNELLPFICQSDAFFDHALDTSAGSLSPRTSWSALKDFEFALPPLEEQKRIAEILWAADDALEQGASSIRASQSLLTASLHQELTFSKPKRRLGEVAKIKHGWAFKSKYFSDHDKAPILLTPGNFSLEGQLQFAQNNTKHYEGEIPENFVLDAGDLVVVMTDLTPAARLLGMPAIVEIEHVLLHNQRIGKLIFDGNCVSRDYLYFSLLNDGYRKCIRATASGSTVKHTSPQRLLETGIYLPSLDQQEQIVNRLAQIQKSVSHNQMHLGQLRRMSKQLRTALVVGNDV